MQNPILSPTAKTHQTGNFSRSEVTLANRNCGTLLETLQHDVTPVGAHYLLNHFDIPCVDNGSNWPLTVTGLVDTPLNYKLDELIEQSEHNNIAKTLRVTLECAGNGRVNINPRWPSQPWQLEAVGTSDWRGVPLRELLEQAGLQSGSQEIVFYGADQGVDGGNIHHFARSLSIADALHNDVLLVWQMNGQPLPPQHGYPLRLIVPGWYGMASVKWLSRIEVIDHAFDGHQQTGTYIYRENKQDTGTPVTTIRVMSLMVPPGIPDWSSRARLVKPGTVALTGRAWSGAGAAITKVEWSSDDQWHEAQVHPSKSKYGWHKWTADWQATVGKHTLRCRATDEHGNIQPLTPPWDLAGFGNNAAQHLDLWCDNF